MMESILNSSTAIYLARLKLVTVAVGAVSFASVAIVPAQAVSYVYVGDWAVDSGPGWSYPYPYGAPVYTGQEAAALLFGGSPSGYVISTNGPDPALINFSAWEDGWGDPYTYAISGTPAAENYSLDEGGLGYNSECYLSDYDNCYKTAFSAYVEDHGVDYINYAFSVSGVPESSTWGMMLVGFAGLGIVGWRRALNSVAARPGA